MKDMRQDAPQTAEQKREMLRKILETKSKSKKAFPLSKGQSSMWFVYHLEPDSHAYHILFSGRIVSPLRYDVLNEAIQQLSRRHEALRTTFETGHDGQPMQVVHHTLELPVHLHHVSQLSDSEIYELVAQHAKVPFQLEKQSPARFHLYENERETIVLLVVHHIVSDYWSLSILVDELAALYTSILHGTPSQLPKLGATFESFMQQQSKLLNGPESESKLAYWKAALGGELPLLELPTDYARPHKQTFNGNSIRFLIDPKIVMRIDEAAGQFGVTSFTVLLAIYNILLFRYTSQNDIVVGIPTAGRQLTAYEDVVGYFSNPIAVRAACDGHTTVRALIDQVKETMLQAMQHQDVPFAVVVDEVGVHRNSSRTPIFQSMFAYQRAPRLENQQFSKFMIGDPDTVMQLGSLTIKPYPLPQQEGQFDLSLSIIKDGGYLQGVFLYNTDLFSADKMNRMSQNFVTLVESALLHPDAPIDRLRLITPEEEQLLLADNDKLAYQPAGGTLIDYFDRAAAATPDKIAVACGQDSMTYRQLDLRSSQLAHQLLAADVQVGTPVGLFAERSIDTVIGALGIWKAGAVYVPLDKSYPEERLAYIVQDSGIKRIIHSTTITFNWNIPLMRIQTTDPVANDRIALSSIPETTDAYLLYTSGSTGRPKGVVVKHNQLLHHILAAAESYGITANDCVLQFSSFNFDTSIEQILVPLLHGAKLVLRDEELWSPSQFHERAEAEQISVSNLPTAYWYRLVDEWHRNQIRLPSALRLFIVGGEAMLPQHLHAWNSLEAGATRLFNVYGPTETIITSHLFEIVHGTEWEADKPIPIGKAMCRRASYVMDEQQQLVPLGVPGELYIGGYSIADGYWNQKELTKEKFIANPWYPGSNQRMYRTGDLVRLMPDGNLEFLGRRDKQVKIRGFRIEMEEVESVLARHPAIRECIVVVKQSDSGGTRLAAYFISSDELDVNRADLQSFMSLKLPAYSIPSQFIQLEELPLTPNGKIDRALLAQLDHATESTSPLEEETPSSAVEIELAAIWSALLQCSAVRSRDNFFELGGDSITGLQMIMLAGQRGIKISPKHIFQHQTIAELARVAEIVQPSEQIQDAPAEGPLPLTPIQHWFLEQHYPQPGHYNQTALLYMNEHVNPAALEKAINLLCEHHDALRMSFKRIEGQWIQHQSNDYVPIQLQAFELPSGDKPLIHHYIDETTIRLQQSMDLLQGNTILAAYFQGNAIHPSCLLIVIHHLLVDGVSWRILLDDLQSVCQQLENGDHAALPPRTTSFKQWSEQLSTYAQGESVRKEWDYWRSELTTAASYFPVDNEAGANLESSARRIQISLTEAVTRQLLTLAPKSYHASINELLLGALLNAYISWSGSNQLLIDLESHGREELFDNVNISRTVGWFTSMYPVVLDNRGDASLVQSIKHAKLKLRQVPNNGIGYGLLSYLSSDPHVSSLKSMPNAPLCFNYLGQLDAYSTTPQLFAVSQLNAGLPRDPASVRSHLVALDCAVIKGQLQINFTYSSNLHMEETIASFARQYEDVLIATAATGQAYAAEALVPSDFPLATLDSTQLAQIIERYDNVEEIYRLSPMQSGMLFHSLLHTSASPPYIAQFNCVIRGALDPNTLETAWTILQHRHALLRTAFVWNGVEEPLQVVCTAGNRLTGWTYRDWSDYPAAAIQEKLNELLAEDRRTPFELAEPSSMRFNLIKLSDDRFHFTWTHHHILLDGWSLAILLKQSFNAYESLCCGKPVENHAAPSYKQYIQWISNLRTDEAKTFWQQYLQGFQKPVALEKRSANDKLQAVWLEEEWSLDREQTDRLRRTSMQLRVTVNLIIQSLWALLLHYYSGNKDIVFGATTAGRPSEIAGIEQTAGLFINTLPVRTVIEPELSAGAWLDQLQKQQAEARSFESTPLFLIQQWSEVPRGTELFDSIVVFENYPIDRSNQLGAGLELESAFSYVQLNYSLALEVTPGEQMAFQIEYDSSAYDAAVIGDIKLKFNKLISGIIESPDSTINELLLRLRRNANHTNMRPSLFSRS
ncbi:hypothetical protein PCCS19_30120 [Paenibacillus sp. CCS19]|nr:hypothetical protein PCCS19_30120 [Paenibacillus cellulosilyticus]